MTVSTLKHEHIGSFMDASSKSDRFGVALQSVGFSASTASPNRSIDPLSVTKRLQRDGRWPEAEPIRNRLMKECRQQGMSKPDAQVWTYTELDRLYPPLETVQTVSLDSELGFTERGNVTGLNDLPDSWGKLPGNSSLQAEIGWVQANRLWVIEENPDGSTVVHLDRAINPAPSWSALSWLEASIRVYSKFVDVAAKVTAKQQDVQELERQELKAIDDLKLMLAAMLED